MRWVLAARMCSMMVYKRACDLPRRIDVCPLSMCCTTPVSALGAELRLIRFCVSANQLHLFLFVAVCTQLSRHSYSPAVTATNFVRFRRQPVIKTVPAHRTRKHYKFDYIFWQWLFFPVLFFTHISRSLFNRVVRRKHKN